MQVDPDKRVETLLELWKTTIEVQQHFNDLEWKIRGLGLSVVTLTIGGAAVAVKDGTVSPIFGWQVQLGAFVLALGSLFWLVFYFVDQVWYHRLLMGSVKHGERLEQELQALGVPAGLTMEISKSSPYAFSPPWSKSKRLIHSRTKLKAFYLIVAGLMIAAASFIQIGLSEVDSEMVPSTPPVRPSVTHPPGGGSTGG